LTKEEKIQNLIAQNRDLEGVLRLLKEEGGCITIYDDIGNKKMVKGVMGGYAVREVTGTGWKKTQPPIGIGGLDRSWLGKKALVILLEEPLETA